MLKDDKNSENEVIDENDDTQDGLIKDSEVNDENLDLKIVKDNSKDSNKNE